MLLLARVAAAFTILSLVAAAKPTTGGRCKVSSEQRNESIRIKCASVATFGAGCPIGNEFACRAPKTENQCLPDILPDKFIPDMQGCRWYNFKRCESNSTNENETSSCPGYCLVPKPEGSTPVVDPWGLRANPDANEQRRSNGRRLRRSPQTLSVRRDHIRIADPGRFPFSAAGIIRVLLKTKDKIPATDLPNHEHAGAQSWHGTHLDELIETERGNDNLRRFYGLASSTCSGFLLEDCRLVASAAHCAFYQLHNDSAFDLVLAYFVPAAHVKKIETGEEPAADIIAAYKRITSSGLDSEELRSLASRNIYYARIDEATMRPLYHVPSSYLRYYKMKVTDDDFARQRASISAVDYALFGLYDSPAETGVFFVSKRPMKSGVGEAQLATVIGFPGERSCDQMLGTVSIQEATLMAKELAIVMPKATADLPFRRLIFGHSCLLSGISGSPVLQGRLPDVMPAHTWATLFKKGRATLEELPIFVRSIASGWEDLERKESDDDGQQQQRFLNGPDLLLPPILQEISVFISLVNDGNNAQMEARACAPSQLRWNTDTTDTKTDGSAWRIRYTETIAFQQSQPDRPVPFFPNDTQPYARGDERTMESYPGTYNKGWLPPLEERDDTWNRPSFFASIMSKMGADDQSDEPGDDDEDPVSFDDYEDPADDMETDQICSGTEDVDLVMLDEHLKVFL